MKFAVTRHFKVYGNKTGGGSRYKCNSCDWVGFEYTKAQEHYESRHQETATISVTPDTTLTPEEASNALSFLARRILQLEKEKDDLNRRNDELLKALGGSHRVRLAEEVRQVYQSELAKR